MLGFDDLEAAGTCGLWEALLCFDPDQEQSFVSFASTRISWVVSGEVRKADPLGYKARRSVQRCWRAVAALEERLGREATEKEAAAAYGVSQKQYRKLRTWDLRSLNVELTEPLANYLSETDGDPLERLCAIEEALEGIGEDDQEIKEAAEEIGIAVENVKGYFSVEGAA